MNQQPLSDITVLDLSHILSGPFVTMTLGDFGARIIKVEPPSGDATRKWGPPFLGHDAAYFYAINRNKESVEVDLKDPAGRAFFERMVRQADVVVENFRPGTLQKLGYDFPRLITWNPRIILCSISGFGQTGPRHGQTGFDQIAQGMSGLMSVTGEAGGEPLRAGFSVGDLSAAMWALVGILVALRHRDKTGEGQWVDVSLLDSLISFQTFQAQNYFATGQDPVPCGSAHPNLVPYQAFRCQDGYINVAVGNDNLWRAFCQALNLPLADDPKFRTNPDRVAHKDELLAIISDRLATEPVSRALDTLAQYGVPAGPIYKISEVFEDAQVKSRHLLFSFDSETLGSIYQINTPVKLSKTPPVPRSVPPQFGEHTEKVRQEIFVDSPGIVPGRP